jgi:hypothetical protein
MIDNKILEFLNLFDDDYIVSLSNVGYLKRSKKDLEKIKDEIKVINESPLEIEIQDNKVIFNDAKIDEITCTCPDSKFCRHRIISIFYIKENYSITQESTTVQSDAQSEELSDYLKGILEFLNLFDDDYIVSLSNAGYLKRSKKDLEKIKDEIKVINESPLEIEIQDNKVVFNDAKIDEITCTCPDSKFCRHRIISIFYIKENYSLKNATLPAQTEKDLSLNYKELLDFDLKSLEKKFTKAKFQKGVKYFLGSKTQSEITENSLNFIFSNDFNDEVIKFSFRSILPLENNNCNNISCKGKKDCEHNVASMLCYLTENDIIKKEEVSELIKKDLKPIDEKLLKEVEEVFLEIINLGLTKMTFAISNKIKKLAFKIHYEVPAFEKIMNGIERDLNSFISKSPKFDLGSFRNKIIRFFRVLRLYRADSSNYKMIDELTRHRSEYVDVKEITLYGAGKEYVEIGDNAILKTYFLSNNNSVFTRSIFLSLKADNSYKSPRSQLSYMPLWEGLVSDAFLNKKTLLRKTKINSDLVISSITSSVSVLENHNFEGLFKHQNFSILKDEYLKFRKENALLSINYKPFYCLIKPESYNPPSFEYESQSLEIEVFDSENNLMTLKFRYGDVPKRYQNNRKKIFDRIISEFTNEKKEKPQLIFGKPYIENNGLFINVVSFFYEKNNRIINPDMDWEEESK